MEEEHKRARYGERKLGRRLEEGSNFKKSTQVRGEQAHEHMLVAFGNAHNICLLAFALACVWWLVDIDFIDEWSLICLVVSIALACFSSSN